MSLRFKLHIEVLLNNINFLISKQIKLPKANLSKMVKQWADIAMLRYVMFFTQTYRALQLNISKHFFFNNKILNKYFYCKEPHLFAPLFLF